jgi:hypothetical protein
MQRGRTPPVGTSSAEVSHFCTGTIGTFPDALMKMRVEATRGEASTMTIGRMSAP